MKDNKDCVLSDLEVLGGNKITHEEPVQYWYIFFFSSSACHVAVPLCQTNDDKTQNDPVDHHVFSRI